MQSLRTVEVSVRLAGADHHNNLTRPNTGITNRLQPDMPFNTGTDRGQTTPEEQLRIIELHLQGHSDFEIIRRVRFSISTYALHQIINRWWDEQRVKNGPRYSRQPIIPMHRLKLSEIRTASVELTTTSSSVQQTISSSLSATYFKQRHNATRISRNLPPEIRLRIFTSLLDFPSAAALANTSRMFNITFRNHAAQILFSILRSNPRWQGNTMNFFSLAVDLCHSKPQPNQAAVTLAKICWCFCSKLYISRANYKRRLFPGSLIRSILVDADTVTLTAKNVLRKLTVPLKDHRRHDPLPWSQYSYDLMRRSIYNLWICHNSGQLPGNTLTMALKDYLFDTRWRDGGHSHPAGTRGFADICRGREGIIYSELYSLCKMQFYIHSSLGSH